MAGEPKRPGSPTFDFAALERITRLEADLKALERRFEEYRDHVDERLEELVRTQAAGEHEMRGIVEAHKKDVAGKLDQTNELLNKINNKLSIHAFIFAVLSALGLSAAAAFAKSVFDRMFE